MIPSSPVRQATVEGMNSTAARRLDVASAMEQGERDSQQDAVRTASGSDGSWVIAVADGTGGGINADQVAAAAVAALPARIASDEGMLEAFAAANRAARLLGPDDSRAVMDKDLYAGWTRDPDCTLVVAAWTPEGGLVVGWVGDSAAVVIPHKGIGWCSGPQQVQAGSPIIGEFAAPAVGVPDSLRAAVSLLSTDMDPMETGRMVSEGAVVVAVSDGAYRMSWGDEAATPTPFVYQHHLCPDEDGIEDGGADLIVGRRLYAPLMERFLPAADRHCPAAAVARIMTDASAEGLHDNASAAAAIVRPASGGVAHSL